jgi:hypothetical protein
MLDSMEARAGAGAGAPSRPCAKYRCVTTRSDLALSIRPGTADIGAPVPGYTAAPAPPPPNLASRRVPEEHDLDPSCVQFVLTTARRTSGLDQTNDDECRL